MSILDISLYLTIEEQLILYNPLKVYEHMSKRIQLIIYHAQYSLRSKL